MKSKKIIAAVVLLVSGVMLGAVIFSGFNFIRPGLANIVLGAKTPPVNLNADASAFSQAFIEVAEKATPSIVQITVVAEKENDPHKDLFMFPFNMPKEQVGSGSGIIISDDGYILTNNHVVEDAKEVSVQLYDKRTFEAKVIGTDKLTDLAVIKIKADGLDEAFLGNSDKIKVGQWVMAIGNPLSLKSTVTAGIISALNRGNLNIIKQSDNYQIESFIQTDAAINPGNSGGALVDLTGAVIGINTAIATQTGTYMGYGFAIPINLAQSVAKDLIANGKVNRGYIGVKIREIDGTLAKSLGLNKAEGVIVEGLVNGGAASKTDIKRGDVILKIDGKEINQSNELQSYVASKTAGQQVKVTIFRDGQTLERTVTLKARDENEKVTETASADTEDKAESEKASMTFDNLGLSVKNLSDKEKELFKVDNGVVITKVKPFLSAGLAEGMIITKADKKKVESVGKLKLLIDAKKGSAILLEVSDSRGNSYFVGLDVPEK